MVPVLIIAVEYVEVRKRELRLTPYRPEDDKYRNRFLEQVKKGIKEETLTNAHDLKRVLESIYDVTLNEKNSRIATYNLRRLMEWLIAGDLLESAEKNVEWKTIVDTYLREIESQNPYEELPEQERIILQDIDDDLSCGNYNKTSSKLKLKHLSDLIHAKHLENSKLQKTSIWSFRIAVVGIAFTVAFGALSLFLFFSG